MTARHPNLRSPRAAFTLVELLVVIAIIAILMALLYPAISTAKTTAKKGQAGTEVRNIVSACKSYYNDYGKFPPFTAAQNSSSSPIYYSYGDTAAAPGGHCQVGNAALFNILRAIDDTTTVNANPAHAMNKRQQKYYESTAICKDVANPRGGFTDGSQFASPLVQGTFYDPWGAQYCIILDATGNDQIDMSPFFTDLSGTANVIRSAATCFSMGTDSKIGGKNADGTSYSGFRPVGAQPPDDIVSWQ